MLRFRSAGVLAGIALAVVAAGLCLQGPSGAASRPAGSVALGVGPALSQAVLNPGEGPWARVARSHRRHRSGDRNSRPQPGAGIPQEAWQVLEYVRAHGRAPNRYVGGRTFQNRERRLPAGGSYREFDVHPKVPGKNRGPERLVIEWRGGRPGGAWYTPDHYRTFLPMRK